MRSIRRLLTATAVGVAMTAGTIAVAGPAAASPEDGQGCVGTPAVPASYVCVISVTPGNALPTTTTSYVPVNVPPVCYFLDCTDASTVNVPIPGATLNNGAVVVLWYQGVSYPIGLGLGGTVMPIVQGAINLVVREAGEAVETVNRTVDNLGDTAQPWIDYVVDAYQNLPTTGELINDVNRRIDDLVYDLQPYLETVGQAYQDAMYEVDRRIYNLQRTLQRYLDTINDLLYGDGLAELVDNLRDNQYVELVIELINRILQPQVIS